MSDHYLTRKPFGNPEDYPDDATKAACKWLNDNVGTIGSSVVRSLADMLRFYALTHGPKP